MISALVLFGLGLGCGGSLDADGASGDLVEGTQLALASAAPAGPPRHKLSAWAALPSTARTPGPTSGHFITPANGVVPPFPDAQPIPGWSGLLANRDGTFSAMPDNGYGAKGNSADYLLGLYNVTMRWKTRGDGTTAPGPVTNNTFVAYNDRRGLLNNPAST